MSELKPGQWSCLEIAGTTCDIFAPRIKTDHALIYLHDTDQETLKYSDVWTPLLEEHGFLTVCPHGGRSWWVNRVCSEFNSKITPEEYLIKILLVSLGERWGFIPSTIGLIGSGMGGQGAIRLALKYPDRFPVVGGISAAIDFQNLYGQGTPLDAMYTDREDVRQDTATLHVHPLNWPRHMLFTMDPNDREWLEGNHKLHEKLSALGIPHETDFDSSMSGNSREYVDYVACRILEFMVRGLEKERLRVPPSEV